MKKPISLNLMGLKRLIIAFDAVYLASPVSKTNVSTFGDNHGKMRNAEVMSFFASLKCCAFTFLSTLDTNFSFDLDLLIDVGTTDITLL